MRISLEHCVRSAVARDTGSRRKSSLPVNSASAARCVVDRYALKPYFVRIECSRPDSASDSRYSAWREAQSRCTHLLGKSMLTGIN